MARQVLIVGQQPDPHIERVAEFLKQEGCKPLLFDCYKKDSLMRLKVGRHGISGALLLNGAWQQFEHIQAVWWRWKPIVAGEWTGVFSEVGGQFRSREWRDTLRSLPAFLPHARWVNPLYAHLQISRKPYQMALAQKVGLRVPETLFSNDPLAVTEAFDHWPRMVYKTISSFIIPPNEIIFTNEISKKEVQQSQLNIKQCPGTFQERVSKLSELRVTIVGEELFAVRINSQKFPDTKLDWRHSQFQDMYEPTTLDPELSRALLAFHHQAQLVFGAYDLIVPPEGEPIFLECNPGGQWLWLELKLGLPISKLLAHTLAT